MLDKLETIDTIIYNNIINTISIESIENDTIILTKKKKSKTKKKREICRPVLFISDSSSSETE
jgi:hypothetical protein